MACDDTDSTSNPFVPCIIGIPLSLSDLHCKCPCILGSSKEFHNNYIILKPLMDNNVIPYFSVITT